MRRLWSNVGSEQVYSDADKAEVWVKVAEAYLESDETDAADNFCNKASKLDRVCSAYLQRPQRQLLAISEHARFGILP